MINVRKFLYQTVLSLCSLILALIIVFVVCEFSYRAVKVAGLLTNKTFSVKDQQWRVYDELLGWMNKKNVDTVVDMGSGERSFSINSQGFRGKTEYSKDNPNRIIALGDSFTFGYGEDNDETYPYFLEQEFKQDIKNIEVVNMSCTAYGLDQEYLWFKRDGEDLNGKILVLGLLDLNFSRATLSRWIQGENKPRFKIVDGGLELTNVPVPKPAPVGSSRISKSDAVDILFSWRGSYFLSFMRDKLYNVTLFFTKQFPDFSESFRLGKEILRELNALCEERGVKLVIVLFPKSDWEKDLQPVYYSMKSLDEELGVEVIDIVEVFNERGSWKDMYSSMGHFSPEGNAVVARVIYERLKGYDVFNESN